MMRGGYSQAKNADEHIIEVVEKVKEHILSRLNGEVAEFIPIQYKSQVVAGMNYSVKIKTGDNQYVHVQIFQDLPCNGGNIGVSDVTTGKTLEDSL